MYSAGVSCPYSTDNGCIYSTSYVASPAFQDTTFPYDISTSGQLPTDCINATTCTVNTNAISNLTALYHQNNVNYPYWDYSIGSANPATLTAASTINDATCKFQANGAWPSGMTTTSGPIVTCQQVSSTPGTYTLAGYDFTNAGSGTGTACVLLYVKANTVANSVGGATNYNFQNNYHKASNGCFQYVSGTPAPLIFNSMSGGYIGAFEYDNITCDGNFDNRPDTTDSITGYISGTTLTVVTGSLYAHPAGELLTDNGVITSTRVLSGTGPTYTLNTTQTLGSAGSPVSLTGHQKNITGNVTCIFDNRTGNSGQNNLTIKYSLIQNLGHEAVYGQTGGDENFLYNAFINNCVSQNCHGEMYEHTAPATNRNADIEGNIQVAGGNSNQIDNFYVSWTTHIYLTSGLNNGVSYNNIYLKNNLLVSNKSNCLNHGSYNPGNPCTGVGSDVFSGTSTNSSVSRAFFDIDGVSSINSLNVTGNVVATQGSYQCITRDNANGGANLGAVMGVLSPGVNFTVTTRPNAYATNGSSHTGYYPGMLLVDINATDIANGWANATIQSLNGATSPVFIPTAGTLCAAGAGAPGQAGGTGCGSWIMSASEPTTVGSYSDFAFLVGLNGITWSNNWSVGGAYGVSARSYPNPGYGTWSSGSTASSYNTGYCP